MDEYRSRNSEDEYALNQDIKQLKDLDNLLKCSICYEYFDTCVVTDCSHNFCSLCIRKYIQYKTECPVCFHQLYDSQLRANRIIDNFVDSFPNLKDSLIRQLRTLKALNSNCVYVSPSKVPGSTTPAKYSSHSKKVTENSANRSENKDSNPCSTSIDSDPCRGSDQTSELNKVVIPKMFQSPIKRNRSTSEHFKRKFVLCPVCQVEIPESSINLHLDDCLNKDRDGIRKKHELSIRRKHLPKLVYRLMTTNELRSKLKEHGLNSHGDFEALKARLQKYTALYNAECDRTNPRPIQDIVRQLEREEKILSTCKSLKSPFTIFRDDVASTEKQNEQYLKENKESFQTLISNLQSRTKVNDQGKISAGEEFPPKKSLTTNWDCRPSTSKLNHEDHYAGSERNSGCQIEKEQDDVNEIKIEPVCNNFNNEFVKDESDFKTSSEDWIKDEELDIDEIKIEPVCNFENDPAEDQLNKVDVNSVEEIVLSKSETQRCKSKRSLFDCNTTQKKLNDREKRSGHTTHSSSEAERHELSEAGIDAIDLCDVNLDGITTSPVIHKRNTKKRKCNEETPKRNHPRRKK